MKNNQKGSRTNTVIIVILTIILLYLLVPNMIDVYNESSGDKYMDGISTTTDKINTQTKLTQQEAYNLVTRTWGGCGENTCVKVIVTVEEKNSVWYVTAIYEGLMDDSVSAEKKVGIASLDKGVWTLGVPTSTYRCQLNRGHQNFSNELCI